jgi:hypothetical protein
MEFNYPLENLLKETTPSVFCLINEAEKKVDVRFGSSLFRSIATLLEAINDSSVSPLELKYDASKLTLKVLETNLTEDTLRLAHCKWMDYYKNLGYSLYRTTPGNSYNIVVSIDIVKELSFKKYFFVVKLVSKSNSEVVGIFEDHEELSGFLRENYPNNVVHEIVFAKNICTGKYLEKKPIGR